jgi:outer membrane protein TolC
LLDKKRVLEQHIKLSRSSARSDSFAGIHVLKAESDLDFLENEILASEQNIRERQVEIANFINADPNKLKIIAEEPPLSPIPNLSATPTTHQINALKFNLENLRNRESAAKSEWFPDLNIRYKEMGATSMSTRYNEVMFGITLPFVFFWEPNAASKKASAERLQGELELEKQKRSIDSERVTLMSKAELLKKQIENLKEKLIPKAERRMKLVHNLAPRDMETLQDHRETMEAFPELKLKALELRLEYEAVISSLEKYAASKGSSHD